MRIKFIKKALYSILAKYEDFDLKEGVKFDDGQMKGGFAAFICNYHYKHGLTPERLEWIINFYGSLEEAAARISGMNEIERKILKVETWEKYKPYAIGVENQTTYQDKVYFTKNEFFHLLRELKREGKL